MLDVLGEAALRSLLLAGVVQCALWLLRVRQARMLLATWTIVLVASLTMPMLLRYTPLQLPLDTALPRPLIDGAADLIQRPALQPPRADAVIELQARPASAAWPWILYVVVGCGMAARVLLGVGLSLGMLARAVRVRPDWVGRTHVRISREVTGPVTIANVIVLPPDSAQWSPATRQAVLAHEQAHAARWDFALLVVSQLNRALFWFSPLSWWLHHRLLALTELASDDQAIAATHDPLGYAEVLLEMGRRPGRVSRGPAMARPSSLPYRIDRILLDQAASVCISQPRQIVLMIVVAGLSLGVASLIPRQVPVPAVTLFERQPSPRDHAIDPSRAESDGGDPIDRGVALDGSPRVEASTAAAPPSMTATGARPTPRPASTSSSAAPPNAIMASPSQALAPPLPRSADRPADRNPAVARRPGVARQSNQASAGPRMRDASAPPAPGAQETSPHAADGSHLATTEGATAGTGGISLPPQAAYRSASPSLQSGLETVTESTCTGTIAVGSTAWHELSWPNRQPDIVAGQTVPAQARFFHRANGTLWVRFNAFGRPALDLPVRLARSGMTWTGEYGIAYTVQASGENHLAGLAAPIARDSARLAFACMRSAERSTASAR